MLIYVYPKAKRTIGAANNSDRGRWLAGNDRLSEASGAVEGGAFDVKLRHHIVCITNHMQSEYILLDVMEPLKNRVPHIARLFHLDEADVALFVDGKKINLAKPIFEQEFSTSNPLILQYVAVGEGSAFEATRARQKRKKRAKEASAAGGGGGGGAKQLPASSASQRMPIAPAAAAQSAGVSPVFGVPLNSAVEGEAADKADARFTSAAAAGGSGGSNAPEVDANVPRIVSVCAAICEARALESEGVFRLSSSATREAQVQQLFDSGQWRQAAKELRDDGDVHLSASMLRRWLRELPEPLLPPNAYRECCLIIGAGLDWRMRMQALRNALDALPVVTKSVLRRVLRILHTVAKANEKTKMTKDSLATVIAPSLSGTGKSAALMLVGAGAGGFADAARLAALLIEEYAYAFGEKEIPEPELPRARALYAYTAYDPKTELSFEEGDVIVVTLLGTDAEGWWQGHLLSDAKETVGNFPAAYVEMIEDDAAKGAAAANGNDGSAAVAAAAAAGAGDSSGAANKAQRSSTTMSAAATSAAAKRNRSTTVKNVRSRVRQSMALSAATGARLNAAAAATATAATAAATATATSAVVGKQSTVQFSASSMSTAPPLSASADHGEQGGGGNGDNAHAGVAAENAEAKDELTIVREELEAMLLEEKTLLPELDSALLALKKEVALADTLRTEVEISDAALLSEKLQIFAEETLADDISLENDIKSLRKVLQTLQERCATLTTEMHGLNTSTTNLMQTLSNGKALQSKKKDTAERAKVLLESFESLSAAAESDIKISNDMSHLADYLDSSLHDFATTLGVETDAKEEEST